MTLNTNGWQFGSGGITNITGGGTWTLANGAYTFTPATDASRAATGTVITVTANGNSGSVTLGTGGTIALREYPWPAGAGLSDRPLAKVAPYTTISTNGTQDLGSNLTFLNTGYSYRIRQDGTVRSVKVYTPQQVTGCFITVWRLNGATWTIVGQSENIADRLATNAPVTVALTNAITGVRVGDYWSAGYTGAAKFQNKMDDTLVSGNHLRWVATSSATNGFNWSGSAVLSNFHHVVELYMDAPDVVFLGDSITQGVPFNYAMTQESGTAFNRSVYFGAIAADANNWTWQNMGRGSDTTSQMVARAQSDLFALKPRWAVLEGGSNDIYYNVPVATILTNYTALLTGCETNGIKGIVVGILPWANGTASQLTNVATVNAWLKNYCASNNAAHIFLPTYSAMGVGRADIGYTNYWSLMPGFSQDGVHLSTNGNARLGDIIRRALP
jgi:lysophospholipase L1-like esterase